MHIHHAFHDFRLKIANDLTMQTTTFQLFTFQALQCVKNCSIKKYNVLCKRVSISIMHEKKLYCTKIKSVPVVRLLGWSGWSVTASLFAKYWLSEGVAGCCCWAPLATPPDCWWAGGGLPVAMFPVVSVSSITESLKPKKYFLLLILARFSKLKRNLGKSKFH